ncbi:MAG: hypothetical protein ACRCY5_04710 [Phocaeicola sp.]
MKILLLCFGIALTTSLAFAKSMPQFIVTECGTVHRIPDNASIDMACDLLDYWTQVDC